MAASNRTPPSRARTTQTELEERQRTPEVLALELLHCVFGEFDDHEHVLVVGLDDLALVASRKRRNDRPAAGNTFARSADGALDHLLELFNHLLLRLELLLHRLGLVLRGRDLVLQRGDLLIELVNLRFQLDDLVLELDLLGLKLGDLFVLLDDRHLVLAGFGLQLVELVDDGLELAAELGQRRTRRIETALLGLGGLEQAVQELVFSALAGLEELGAVHHRLALGIEDIDRTKLTAVGLVIPVVSLEIGLLEGGLIVLEDVLHVRNVNKLGLDRRRVELDLEDSILGRLNLLDGLGDADDVVLLHLVAISQLRALFVELKLKIEAYGGHYQKHVDENVQKFIHSLFDTF